MDIRLASERDLPEAMSLFDEARAFMRANGNTSQWVNGYPAEGMLRADIEAGSLYVCEQDGRIVGVFYFAVEDEPTYAVIEGAWLDDEPYGVLHRIASATDVRGVGTFCIDWAIDEAHRRGAAGGLRIDTHADNAPMRGLLTKLGFTECGIITIDDGTPRVAYHHL